MDIAFPVKYLEADMYDKAIEYIKISYLQGVTHSLREGEYYKLLPPRLKNQLINDVLHEYHSQFYFFFHDVQNKNHADEIFIRKILSNLDCQM